MNGPRGGAISSARGLLLSLFLAAAPSAAVSQAVSPDGLSRGEAVDLRALSWNVAGEEIFGQSDDMQALIRWVDPDLLLLDEVPGGFEDEILGVVRGLRGEADTLWNVLIGAGGGYQRGAIVTRHPIEPLSEFAWVPYADSSLAHLRALMPDGRWERSRHNLEAGHAVAGAIVRVGDRSVLAVALDLQCCNTEPEWQEMRRQIEAREIRRLIQGVLARRSADAVLVAGDLNLVSGAAPLVILTNPYPAPYRSLTPAEALQLDGRETWTWDGRGTRFPSLPLDYALYSPVTLALAFGAVVSTEDLPTDVLEALGLESGSSRSLSDHLPLVTDYQFLEIE